MPGYGQNTDIDAAAERLSPSSIVVQYGVVVMVLGDSANSVYFGNDSSVTTSNGFPVLGGSSQSFDKGWFSGDLTNIYAIGSTTNMTVAWWYI